MVDHTSVPPYPTPSHERTSSTVQILLVEDDPEMRSLVAQVLRQRGYGVRETGDADTAVAILTDRQWFPNPPDLLVSDLRMPGYYDGLSVVSVIRKAGIRIPTILMTAFADRETHEAARRLGVRRVLDKPFDLATLLEEVQKAIPPHHNPRPPVLPMSSS